MSEAAEITDQEVIIFVEETALLLACLRNYGYAGQEVDLLGALSLGPKLAEQVEALRRRYPRAG